MYSTQVPCQENYATTTNREQFSCEMWHDIIYRKTDFFTVTAVKASGPPIGKLTIKAELISVNRPSRLPHFLDNRNLPPERFLVLISVRAWVHPRAIVRLEELMLIEKSSDLVGIRTRTFLLVALCLNQLRYRVPRREGNSNFKTCSSRHLTSKRWTEISLGGNLI
jgi:hypothetical protein